MVCIVSEKGGSKFDNLAYCSSLQLAVVYSFSEIESTFSVPFWDYVANCWKLRGRFPFLWKGKVNKLGWLLHEWPLLDFSVFSFTSEIICLLFQILCQDNKFFSLKSISLFPTSVCDFRSFLTVMWFKFYCLLNFFVWWTYEREILLIFATWRFVCVV